MIERSRLPTADEVHRDRFARDSEYAAETERTRFANEVAIAVLRYRVDNDLSEAKLAERLGVDESTVYELEAADEQPSVQLLERLEAAHIVSVEIRPEDGAHAYPWAV